MKKIAALLAMLFGYSLTSVAAQQSNMQGNSSSAVGYLTSPNNAGGMIVLTFKQERCLKYKDSFRDYMLFDGYVSVPMRQDQVFIWFQSKTSKSTVYAIYLEEDGHLAEPRPYELGAFTAYNYDGTRYNKDSSPAAKIPLSPTPPMPKQPSEWQYMDVPSKYLH